MKRMLALFALVAMLGLNGSAEVNTEKPFVIPEVAQWTGAEGTIQLDANTRIVAVEALRGVAEKLAADYATMFGQKLTVVTNAKAAAGDIVLTLKAAKKPEKEGYTLQIGRTVTITAATEAGAYWATRTLLQMADQEGGKLPCGTIVDQPKFEIRGFMLDCGRKFIPMSYLRTLVKTMGYYKMNMLQLHLNDNGFKKYFEDDWGQTPAAFRLECDTYPGLTARDGFYTKKEFIELQELAASCGVEIVPEIDAPAHVLAFTHYDPSLASDEYGMDHFDLHTDKPLNFMKALWKEYLEGPNPVFRGPRVDIGTDEYSNRDKDVVEKFRAFTDQLIRHVEGYGKQAMFWGSLTHAKGETPVKSENVIMSMWYNGYANPKEMKEQGYKFISIPDGLVYIVPKAGYYYDYLNIQHLYNNWTPNKIADVEMDYDDPCVLGGMFAVWNDICGNGITYKDVHHRIMPAMQTLSAKFWRGKDVTVPFDDFNAKRLAVREAPGVNQSGRHGVGNQLVLEQADVKPGMTLPIEEIGFDYTVRFKLTYQPEAKGTVLFASEASTFYLADPVTGRFGYSCDGYATSFNFAPYPGETLEVAVAGNQEETRLYINGQLREIKAGRTVYRQRDNGGEFRSIETLMFPLKQVGQFKSQVSNLKVYNFIDFSMPRRR